jgi:hypothetical protein
MRKADEQSTISHVVCRMEAAPLEDAAIIMLDPGIG